jgi:hypothetical protein
MLCLLYLSLAPAACERAERDRFEVILENSTQESVTLTWLAPYGSSGTAVVGPGGMQRARLEADVDRSPGDLDLFDFRIVGFEVMARCLYVRPHEINPPRLVRWDGQELRCFNWPSLDL